MQRLTTRILNKYHGSVRLFFNHPAVHPFIGYVNYVLYFPMQMTTDLKLN